MTSKRLFILACMAATASVTTACSSLQSKGPGQYWQRANVSESIYLRGPKAQQMLNRDIAACVNSLKELERLGVLKNSIPTGMDGRVQGPDERELTDWDTPERERYLFAEHTNYHDFESCMLASSWERIEHVPYKVAVEARDVYIQEQIDYKYRTRIDKPRSKATTQDVGDFSMLND